jgi:hypothetical protein
MRILDFLNTGLWRKPDFIHLFADLKKYEGDPLSPRRGGTPRGVSS